MYSGAVARLPELMNTKPQNGWGWKEPLEAIWFKMASRQAGHKQDHTEQGKVISLITTLYFLLNFTRFLSAHLSSLSRSLWMSVLPFVESAISLRFVHSTNLLRLHSTLPSRSLMKVLNRTGPSIDTLNDDELKMDGFIHPVLWL